MHELTNILVFPMYKRSAAPLRVNVSVDIPRRREQAGGGHGNHRLTSKEWQSAAFREGWANFYYAVVYNKRYDPSNGHDCEAKSTSETSWNKDNDTLDTTS